MGPSSHYAYRMEKRRELKRSLKKRGILLLSLWTRRESGREESSPVRKKDREGRILLNTGKRLEDIYTEEGRKRSAPNLEKLVGKKNSDSSVSTI